MLSVSLFVGGLLLCMYVFAMMQSADVMVQLRNVLMDLLSLVAMIVALFAIAMLAHVMGVAVMLLRLRVTIVPITLMCNCVY